ncbi:helix-turn-helix domain-containing protein [Devosia sp.]|uniref:helix-turn-helix domain-containing protein n=1 Tax=Devosia sp. TaxID=1871048 RepID=UPI002733BB4F|nr:helix-turn-helix domain-containing protein [Devosia sp.]MDP2779845.1 helix-turn-helix domain-containing protein [Devosia sp.]
MSVRALTWAAGQKAGSGNFRAVLWVLADRSDDHGVCWLGQQLIAEIAEISERTARDALQALTERKLITRERRQRKSGSRTSDLIRLSIPADFAVRRVKKSETLPAKSAGDLPANTARVTGEICRGYLKEETKPLNPLKATEADMAIRDVLTDIGVSADTAEALMNAYAFAGHPLDIETVKPLARNLDGPEPDRRARHLLENGLGRIGGRRSSRAPAQAPAPAQAMRRVNRELEPDLWRRCCEASSHPLTMTGKDGGWPFDADLVDGFEAVP